MICPKRCSCSGVSRSRSEPLETKPRRSHSCFYCLRNDHTVITVLVDAQFVGLFSLPDVRHLAATVAPLSHDSCCRSDFLLWLIFFFLGGGYFRSFLCRWPRLRVMSGSCSPELKAERSRHQRYEAAAFQIPIRARRPSKPSDPSNRPTLISVIAACLRLFAEK